MSCLCVAGCWLLPRCQLQFYSRSLTEELGRLSVYNIHLPRPFSVPHPPPPPFLSRALSLTDGSGFVCVHWLAVWIYEAGMWEGCGLLNVNWSLLCSSDVFKPSYGDRAKLCHSVYDNSGLFTHSHRHVANVIRLTHLMDIFYAGLLCVML